ncbi:MAG: ABC transporter ATP-binding protein [Proteobacteria bacterium]|nr:ABC transporter ATP-binding protein [Pseudomonadota bacterium]
MTEILKVNDLEIAFKIPGGEIKAVDGASFRIREGSTVALVGESGSGKTVISQAIMGILPRNGAITGGEILFTNPRPANETAAVDGGRAPSGTVDIATMAPESTEMRAIRGGCISIIFQEPMTSLSPLHTIGDQIRECLHLHSDVSQKDGRGLCAETLGLVGFPDATTAMRTYPFELSGGLRQRAMIAMALVCRPALLIADEPTTALDVTIQAQILKLIHDLQSELGMAVLMITHDLGVVANVAEEVVVLYRGCVMESGTVEDIFNDPGHPYLQALLRAVPRFGLGPEERLTPIREIKFESAHLLASGERRPDAGPGASGALVTARGLTKRFKIRKDMYFGRGGGGLVTAIDDVDFEIRRGECLGLVGESGCGKTTLSKCLVRAVTPDEGELTFNDAGRPVDVIGLSEAELIPFRRKIQFIFQDPFGSLNPRMTVFDIVNEPLLIHGIGDSALRAEMVKELLKLVGLDIWAFNRYPHSFSGGQRQRIGIARALALKPELLICDEPVSALDVSIQAQILNLLKDLKEELEVTYLFISHNLAVVNYIADRIMVMCAGKIVEVAPCEVLFRNPVHPYTKALLAAIPEPDPAQRLDFDGLMEGKASDPAWWPPPFTVSTDAQPRLIALGEDHFVRATDDTGLGRGAK